MEVYYFSLSDHIAQTSLFDHKVIEGIEGFWVK